MTYLCSDGVTNHPPVFPDCRNLLSVIVEHPTNVWARVGKLTCPPLHAGAEEGIRTHTAMLLRHLPPSVGLPRRMQKILGSISVKVFFSLTLLHIYYIIFFLKSQNSLV